VKINFFVKKKFSEKKVRIPSGIPNYDSLISGGFEKKSTNLLVGGSGSGKSIFATQFLIEGMRKGEACLYVTFEEEKELMRKYKEEGDIGARNKVVMDQQWMVSRMARKYSNNGSFMDLVNRGNEGLIYALENFDISIYQRIITILNSQIFKNFLKSFYYKLYSFLCFINFVRPRNF